MTTIQQMADDGFSLSSLEHNVSDLALLSLRTALVAYFSTYRIVRSRLSSLTTPISGLSPQQARLAQDANHSTEYCQACSEAISHFHHFIELTIKELLRREHPLLACKVPTKASTLVDVIKKKELAEEELEQIRTIEFADSLERICDLIKTKRISGHGRLAFIPCARHMLEILNNLRNRIAHRGTYVLRYEALDQFVGRAVLPFASKLTTLPVYDGTKFGWRYRPLNCRSDPIRKIIAEGKLSKLCYERIALLKELGRAAYQNPLPRGPVRRQTGVRARNQAESEAQELAKTRRGQHSGMDVKICPVCGVKSLLIYGDFEYDYYMAEEPEETVTAYSTVAVKCLCCSFEIENELGEEAFAGIPIRCYWHRWELASP